MNLFVLYRELQATVNASPLATVHKLDLLSLILAPPTTGAKHSLAFSRATITFASWLVVVVVVANEVDNLTN